MAVTQVAYTKCLHSREKKEKEVLPTKHEREKVQSRASGVKEICREIGATTSWRVLRAEQGNLYVSWAIRTHLKYLIKRVKLLSLCLEGSLCCQSKFIMDGDWEEGQAKRQGQAVIKNERVKWMSVHARHLQSYVERKRLRRRRSFHSYTRVENWRPWEGWRFGAGGKWRGQTCYHLKQNRITRLHELVTSSHAPLLLCISLTNCPFFLSITEYALVSWLLVKIIKNAQNTDMLKRESEIPFKALHILAPLQHSVLSLEYILADFLCMH